MFTLLIIIILVVVFVSSIRPDKHNAKEDADKLASIPAFEIQAKEMSSFSKFLNLAYDDSGLLQYFSYNSGLVTIRMKNGSTITDLLSNIGVEFEKTSGLVIYRVYSKNKKLEFYQTTNISDKEWDAINSILCLAGQTRGRDIFGSTYKTLGYANTALKVISKLY